MPESLACLLELAVESVEVHGVVAGVDCGREFADEVLVGGAAEAAFEDRVLDSESVAFADFRDSVEAPFAGPVVGSDVVGHE